MSETIRGAKELASIYMSQNIPFYIHGKPGVGKSDACAQLAEEQDIGFKDLRLAQMDPVDLMGLPHVIDGESHWARPHFWPVEKRDGAKGLILFDELSDSTKAMQSAAYQVVLNRRIGPHVLPKGWFICAAGNRRIDRAAAGSISTALANRFSHIEVDADPDDWHAWANLNGINPLIIGFLQFRKALLCPVLEGGDPLAFPTPRSWAQVSKVLDDDRTNASNRLRLVQGLIGPGPAGEFEAFTKALNLPTLEEIVAKPKTCRIPSEPASKYALSSMLAMSSERGNFGKICDYIQRSEFGRDFEICTVLDATKRAADLTDTKAFIDFANRNSDLSL